MRPPTVWLPGRIETSSVTRVGTGLVAVTVAEFSAVFTAACEPSIVTVELLSAPAAMVVLPCVRFRVPLVAVRVARTVSPSVYAVTGLLYPRLVAELTVATTSGVCRNDSALDMGFDGAFTV